MNYSFKFLSTKYVYIYKTGDAYISLNLLVHLILA